MILSERLRAVWCETLDDVTLIWNGTTGEEVEFVQVKAENLDQLWSEARLCHRTGGKRGTSVLEKSLAQDRCSEPCRFRFVTRRPLNTNLRVLQAPLAAESRQANSAKLLELSRSLEGKLPGAQSQNGNGVGWWAERTAWEVGHSEEALQNKNLNLVSSVVDELGRYLASDQREQLYDLLLLKVKVAADADKSLDRNAGKLRRDEMLSWLTEQVRRIEHGGTEAGGRALADKLEQAGVSSETVETARELRRSYLSRRIQPNYLGTSSSRDWEDKVRTRLQMLRASLDSGTIAESGVAFHHRTLTMLERLRDEAQEATRPSEQFLLGCMYHITDVCQHRFTKAEV